MAFCPLILTTPTMLMLPIDDSEGGKTAAAIIVTLISAVATDKAMTRRTTLIRLLESIKTCGRSPERIFFTDKPSHTKLKVRADTFFCVTFYLEDANRTAKPTHKLEKLSNDSSERGSETRNFD